MSYNDDIIEQQRKRSKLTKEMTIADIASSIGKKDLLKCKHIFLYICGFYNV